VPRKTGVCAGCIPPCWSLLAVNRHRASPHRETRPEATTQRRPEMRARTTTIAIVIGVAAAGVMALGAQTAAAAVKYDTKVTIDLHAHKHFDGSVKSGGRKCERGRRVVLFELRPGADRKLGTTRSKHRSGPRGAEWVITAKEGA
jgi:hypothetical protein